MHFQKRPVALLKTEQMGRIKKIGYKKKRKKSFQLDHSEGV